MISRRRSIGLGIAALASISIASSASAQRVSADIHIGGYPVSGTIHIGDGHPRPRRVVYERAHPGRIHVEYRRGWNPRRYRNARVIVVYYDRRDDRFYDGFRRGLEEVRVYHHDGRYYRFDDDRGGRYDRDDRRDRRDRDRYESRDRDRDRDWNERDRRDDDRDDDDRWSRDRDH